MTLVVDILRDALGHLRVADAAEALKADEARDAMRALNLMARRWEASGIAIGWQEVTSPDDVLPAPPEVEEALGYNLALRLRARYGGTIDADVVELARAGLADLAADVAATEFLRVEYDDLPAGTGQRDGCWRDGLYR